MMFQRVISQRLPIVPVSIDVGWLHLSAVDVIAVWQLRTASKMLFLILMVSPAAYVRQEHIPKFHIIQS